MSLRNPFSFKLDKAIANYFKSSLNKLFKISSHKLFFHSQRHCPTIIFCAYIGLLLLLTKTYGPCEYRAAALTKFGNPAMLWKEMWGDTKSPHPENKAQHTNTLLWLSKYLSASKRQQGICQEICTFDKRWAFLNQVPLKFSTKVFNWKVTVSQMACCLPLVRGMCGKGIYYNSNKWTNNFRKHVSILNHDNQVLKI